MAAPARASTRLLLAVLAAAAALAAPSGAGHSLRRGGSGDGSSASNPPTLSRLLQQADLAGLAPAPRAETTPSFLAQSTALAAPAPEAAEAGNPFSGATATSLVLEQSGPEDAAAPAPEAAAAGPSSEPGFAEEFRLSEEQAATLTSLYGNPADPAATIQADLSAAGVSFETPQPFPAPAPDDTIYDAVLIAAVKQGRVPAVETLLGAAADPNAADSATGETPLFLAIPQASEQPELLQQLLNNGADTNVRDGNGTTPLLLAIEAGDPAAVQALLSAGADANLASGDGVTPLLAAIEGGDPAIIQALLDAGADTNAPGPAGQLPLVQEVEAYLAAPSEAGLGLIEAMLDAGAAPGLADAQGTSALTAAEQSGDALLGLLARYAPIKSPAAEALAAADGGP